jgi:hypothetical protein
MEICPCRMASLSWRYAAVLTVSRAGGFPQMGLGGVGSISEGLIERVFIVF